MQNFKNTLKTSSIVKLMIYNLLFFSKILIFYLNYEEDMHMKNFNWFLSFQSCIKVLTIDTYLQIPPQKHVNSYHKC